MVDVPLRHNSGRKDPPVAPQRGRGLRAPRSRLRAPVLAAIAAGVLIAIGFGAKSALDSWQASAILSGLSADTAPVALSIAGEALSIPANAIRSANTRRGGAVERADLILHWPTMGGYTQERTAEFNSGAASLVYATIAPRTSPVDSTARLEAVYARFFVGKAFPGPAGLIGRQLAEDSGYRGEIVFFDPAAAEPFVARCPVEWTDEMPATCIRDFDIGQGLSLLYRFDGTLLAEWQALDAAMHVLTARYLGG